MFTPADLHAHISLRGGICLIRCITGAGLKRERRFGRKRANLGPGDPPETKDLKTIYPKFASPLSSGYTLICPSHNLSAPNGTPFLTAFGAATPTVFSFASRSAPLSPNSPAHPGAKPRSLTGILNTGDSSQPLLGAALNRRKHRPSRYDRCDSRTFRGTRTSPGTRRIFSQDGSSLGLENPLLTPRSAGSALPTSQGLHQLAT